jgi:hypothetical protein
VRATLAVVFCAVLALLAVRSARLRIAHRGGWLTPMCQGRYALCPRKLPAGEARRLLWSNRLRLREVA